MLRAVRSLDQGSKSEFKHDFVRITFGKFPLRFRTLHLVIKPSFSIPILFLDLKNLRKVHFQIFGGFRVVSQQEICSIFRHSAPVSIRAYLVQSDNQTHQSSIQQTFGQNKYRERLYFLNNRFWFRHSFVLVESYKNRWNIQGCLLDFSRCAWPTAIFFTFRISFMNISSMIQIIDTIFNSS